MSPERFHVAILRPERSVNANMRIQDYITGRGDKSGGERMLYIVGFGIGLIVMSPVIFGILAIGAVHRRKTQ